jgi:hypothetical protein
VGLLASYHLSSPNSSSDKNADTCLRNGLTSTSEIGSDTLDLYVNDVQKGTPLTSLVNPDRADARPARAGQRARVPLPPNPGNPARRADL